MNLSEGNCCDFAGDYDLSGLPLFKKLERAALGSDYGATSWTTRAQIDAVLESLQLGSESRLLDIGAGSGWPGLLLGKLSRCDITLIDIPHNALMQAAKRVADDHMSGKVRIVRGSGTALPFRDRSFDRISHSDVLCCLPEKSELLCESRRVASIAARMHFSVILPANHLTHSEYEEVLSGGPPFVGVDGVYEDLLRNSGWRVVEYQDVTPDYRNSLKRLLDGIQHNKKELEELLGAKLLDARTRHRADQLGLIDRGLMRRETYGAIAI